MRIVADTNTAISGLLWQGPPRRLIDACRAQKLTLISSPTRYLIMSVVISDETLQAARLSADELKRELALLLYQQNRLTLGQASQLAGMNQVRFQHLLASRAIPVHYGEAEFEADLKTLDPWDGP